MEKIGVGIGILVYNDKGELLLIKRSSDPFEADSEMRLEGTYTLPSGKMLPLESFEAAAKRKLKEEVGLDVLESDLKLVSISNDLNDYAHYVTIGMVVEKYSGEVKLKDGLEFTSYGWFSEMPKELCEPSRKILNNYLSNKIYSKEER
ncbi:MAG: NUDIX hydrolase [Firmicutes bacterium]|nr:NUDIX hydrolase [Bacillota bacterium]